MGILDQITRLGVESCKKISEYIQQEMIPDFEDNEEQKILWSLATHFGLEANRKVIEKESKLFRSKFALSKD